MSTNDLIFEVDLARATIGSCFDRNLIREGVLGYRESVAILPIEYSRQLTQWFEDLVDAKIQALYAANDMPALIELLRRTHDILELLNILRIIASEAGHAVFTALLSKTQPLQHEWDLAFAMIRLSRSHGYYELAYAWTSRADLCFPPLGAMDNFTKPLENLSPPLRWIMERKLTERLSLFVRSTEDDREWRRRARFVIWTASNLDLPFFKACLDIFRAYSKDTANYMHKDSFFLAVYYDTSPEAYTIEDKAEARRLFLQEEAGGGREAVAADDGEAPEDEELKLALAFSLSLAAAGGGEAREAAAAGGGEAPEDGALSREAAAAGGGQDMASLDQDEELELALALSLSLT